ncbi:MAG TPA: HNH endonuclease signature motif containing protein [Thermodesulfobacteriota bacterium]|nr:HNH endonuclease signature motif containing protein [Thermodesulfobacteriota bacterium]
MKGVNRERTIAELIKRDGYRCRLCHLEFSELTPPEIDHRIPKSKGGDDDLENLQLVHSVCNRKKGTGEFRERKLPGKSALLKFIKKTSREQFEQIMEDKLQSKKLN